MSERGVAITRIGRSASVSAVDHRPLVVGKGFFRVLVRAFLVFLLVMAAVLQRCITQQAQHGVCGTGTEGCCGYCRKR
jgi:hypothetical protein